MYVINLWQIITSKTIYRLELHTGYVKITLVTRVSLIAFKLPPQLKIISYDFRNIFYRILVSH